MNTIQYNIILTLTNKLQKNNINLIKTINMIFKRYSIEFRLTYYIRLEAK